MISIILFFLGGGGGVQNLAKPDDVIPWTFPTSTSNWNDNLQIPTLYSNLDFIFQIQAPVQAEPGLDQLQLGTMSYNVIYDII